jgi:ribosome recycling factor
MDAQTIKIEPRDKSVLSKIEKAIFESEAKLTPQNMGDAIWIKIPPLTTDRRKELTKVVSKQGEENKIALRNIRQDAHKDIKKQFDEKLMSEDDKKRAEEQIDKLTKDYSHKIDQMVDAKSEEIMTI